MYKHIPASEIQAAPNRTIAFEGEPHGSAVSFFLVNSDPGQGPDLHKHPYPETWIVRSGTGRFTAGGQDVEAGAGDILVVDAEVPHKFKNAGKGRLEVVCIHPSPVFIQEDLEE
jgi:mannose-6-phosphate isomerase-like protein (cupin superfamily)